MEKPIELSHIKIPAKGSHKGQNGRLLIIGGSKLFHAASLWSLKVASRIVDLVHYASVPENNQIVQDLKEEFRDGIVIPRKDIESYIDEDDAILIGPGMVRTEDAQVQSSKFKVQSLEDVIQIDDEGLQTAVLTNYLLRKHAHKQWVIDAGALQMMDLKLIPKKAILTAHHGEFATLKAKVTHNIESKTFTEQVQWFAKEYACTLLVKGEVDIVSDGEKVIEIAGGNQGMTKGGTGDVLAGLIAALVTTNDSWNAAVAGSYINKQAGESLFKTMGIYYNASDLADEIPRVMKRLLLTGD